ncbi:hypothetical protein Ancab_035775 [Ancistrocladus abbreviatus]
MIVDLEILTAKDYALILGMLGTGKTSTMVYAVKALLLRGASILLTSYTNTAVDNLLIKLKAEVSLGPLMFASVFVLVGDHYQLPPFVQYRMCAGIMNPSNALIYGNRLRCGSSKEENVKLQFSNSMSVPSWLKKREVALEAALAEKEFAEEECRKNVDEAKKREVSLENDLANMWGSARLTIPKGKMPMGKAQSNCDVANVP